MGEGDEVNQGEGWEGEGGGRDMVARNVYDRVQHGKCPVVTIPVVTMLQDGNVYARVQHGKGYRPLRRIKPACALGPTHVEWAKNLAYLA